MGSRKTKLTAACIGAGPAGLTAGYLLSKAGESCQILEQDKNYVGGISRTVIYNRFRFDIGGHRFFSKSQQVDDFWHEILADDFIERPRKSRIFYRNQFYSYPLKPVEALKNLGLMRSTAAVFSYLWAKCFPIKPVQSFQDWVSNQFGRQLFDIFFKTYTEKVWGMPCNEISADWAAQRIKGLSLGSAIKDALFRKTKSSDTIKSLITTFKYPRLGPGMMWEATAEKIKQMGNQVILDASVVKLFYDEKQAEWRVTTQSPSNQQTHMVHAQHIISSMPVKQLITALDHELPKEVCVAANSLKYRDFLIVALMIQGEGDFDDNWIYIHDPSVKVGRIQNFRSWSPEMVQPGTNCYGLEYFCFENDGLWSSHDDTLLELAKQELVKIGLAQADAIFDGYVIRQPKAYPVYDDGYKHNMEVIRKYLQTHYPTLHLVGRNGMHKYNNQDHAMMTSMLTVDNILSQTKRYDVWQVNEDAEYHEAGEQSVIQTSVVERLVPERVSNGD